MLFHVVEEAHVFFFAKQLCDCAKPCKTSLALTHMKFDGVMRTQNAFDFDIVSSLKKLFQDYCLYIYIYI